MMMRIEKEIFHLNPLHRNERRNAAESDIEKNSEKSRAIISETEEYNMKRNESEEKNAEIER